MLALSMWKKSLKIIKLYNCLKLRFNESRIRSLRFNFLSYRQNQINYSVGRSAKKKNDFSNIFIFRTSEFAVP